MLGENTYVFLPVLSFLASLVDTSFCEILHFSLKLDEQRSEIAMKQSPKQPGSL